MKTRCQKHSQAGNPEIPTTPHVRCIAVIQTQNQVLQLTSQTSLMLSLSLETSKAQPTINKASSHR